MSDKQFWKSLEETQKLGSAPISGENDSPNSGLFQLDFFSRREFMEWASGMAAVVGISACTRGPQEKLIPYTKAPEEVLPGMPLHYATAFGLEGMATGLLAESHMGRPTKIDGNPKAPSSLGASDVFAQASVLSLYDPDRARAINGESGITYWGSLAGKIKDVLQAQSAKSGAGVRILTQSVTSPTLVDQIQKFLAKYPKAQWIQYEAIDRAEMHAATLAAVGEKLDVRYSFEDAETIVSLDSEFFQTDPSSVRLMKEWAARRKVLRETPFMNRLMVFESTPTLVGAAADQKWVVRPHEIEMIAERLALKVGVSLETRPVAQSPEIEKAIEETAKALLSKRDKAVVTVGRWQSARVQALALAINEKLAGLNRHVQLIPAVHGATSATSAGLKNLVSEMEAGQVDALFILGGNPAYDAPDDVPFITSLRNVKFRIHLSQIYDETSEVCGWHIPETHYLEHWSDLRSDDGTVSIVQPLINPLHGGKSIHEVMAALLGDASKSGYDIVRDYWKTKLTKDFEKSWKKSVHDGVVSGTAFSAKKLPVKPVSSWKLPKQAEPQGLQIVFRPDSSVYDGRFNNNGWLQELPRPLSKLTWDNAAYFSPKTAERLNLQNQDVVKLQVENRSIEAPVWILPGQSEETITVHLGYGRTKAGRLGNGTGFNAYRLRTTQNYWVANNAQVQKLSKTYKLACTQTHQSMEGRNLIKTNDFHSHQQNPNWAKDKHHGPVPEGVDVGTAGGVHAPLAQADYQWGMVINLSSCTGCNSCIVACQSENNVPVVGKIEVERGREMHWLRLDRYYEGTTENPQTHFQPVPCMHCETAPCEVVCPVGATAHDNEGLNNMVYNRCVGTKYCSNNCPYKVRRFNFYEYANQIAPTLQMVKNPDVTVRSRGVMEKCTYCVQRINKGRITAKNEKRLLKDQEVKTACQTACPADAIQFGNIADPKSLVSMLKADPLNYGLLPELNTKPRTTYLAKVKNPVSSGSSKPNNSHGNSHGDSHKEGHG